MNNKLELSKIQETKMKELWYNEKDEIWERVSELRPESKEKLATCKICDIKYSKTKPCCNEAVLMRRKDLGEFGKFMGEDYWYWFCPKHGRHDNPNYV